MSSPTDTPASSTVHADLLHGKPVRFDAKKQTEKEREVPAQWIADAVIKGAQINLQHAIISGPLNLKYAVIEKEFSLQNCDILDPADFSYSTFKQNLLLSGTTFANGANFDTATMEYDAFLVDAKFLAGVANFSDLHVQGVLSAQGTHFGEGVIANFNRARFDKSAFFHGTSFGEKANFGSIQVGSVAEFQGAVFKQKVSFNRAKIADSAFFHARPESKMPAATFKGEADFISVEIGSNAEFQEAVFKKPTSFVNAQIGGSTIFHFAKFLANSKPSFMGSRFRQGAFFQGASFEDAVDFRTAEFHLEARFRGATFHKKASFDSSHFIGLAQFNAGEGLPGAVFNNEVSFEHARFDHDARFDDVVFQGGANFREASFLAVYFSPEAKAQGRQQFRGSVDLRGCTYDRIQAHWPSLLKKPDGTPRLEPYDRQPYTQLEKVLRAAGQDRDADDVYLERRRVEHKQKWQRGEFGPWLLDTLHALFANYGIRPYQLLYTPILILLLGTALFFHPDATHRKFSGQTPSDPQQLARTVPGATGEFTTVDAVRLSVRYFLPVEVSLATHWEASDKQYGPLRFSDYATGMKLAGWILVPLGIAALTGLLRRVTP